MRKDIEFKTDDGTILRGWHYVPGSGAGKYPTIVMAHGYSAVKEMYLDKFAEKFETAGFASLVFDNRNFGASDGKVRQEIDPWQQIRDYRDAITFAETLPQPIRTRIGVWGSSYSGAHVIVVGATDRRVKCVSAQVPLISGHNNAQRLCVPTSLPASKPQWPKTAAPVIAEKRPPWCRSSRKILRVLQPCQRAIPGPGSPRPKNCARPRGATR